jgi:PKD repeat protein
MARKLPHPLVALGSSACLVASLAVSAVAGPSNPNFPDIQLPSKAQGVSAIEILGDQLPSVARAYGLQPHVLHHLFRTDPTLNVDRQGRLHYVEPAPQDGAAVEGSIVPEALAPLTDTFKLHSKPGASKVIYLDFDGHVMTGTAWSSGTINAPAWSLDADTANFSDTERTRIQYIWQRVAEDYAPFDVDVTTEYTSESTITRSSSSDGVYGTRVLISPISAAVGFSNAGGVAYLGAFDDVGDYYKPALVFPENLGPNGESYIAEAISHEVGHNFNLNHDGRTSPSEGYYQGQGVWAPIMGVGYYKSLVQWSKGEYAYANNTQDDTSTIASYVGFRSDDHGNTTATASYFPVGTTLSAEGIISTSSDVDVFAFSTGDGAVSINIYPDDRSANLDVLAELRNASGTTIATSNPLGALNASFNLTLSPGTYFLLIRGTGEGNPATTGYSGYGSLGQYFVSGTVQSAGPQVPIAVATASSATIPTGGTITFNGGGSFDPDGGSIVSYSWLFSDGAGGSGSSVSRVLNTPGSYSATLTVTDDEGSTGSSTLTYIVNTPPLAQFTTGPGTSGTAPFAVTFNGSASSDPDAGDSIVSYAWNFGDGTTANGSSVTKTYSSAGTYTAILTVTDSRGATDTEQVTLVVTATPAIIMKVSNLVLTQSLNRNGSRSVRAAATITTSTGIPVSGATVTGTFSGIVSGSATANTSTAGVATLSSKSFRSSGGVTFTVTGVTRSGYSYDASQSVISRSGTF